MTSTSFTPDFHHSLPGAAVVNTAESVDKHFPMDAGSKILQISFLSILQTTKYVLCNV